MNLRNTLAPLTIVLVVLLAATTLAGFLLVPAGTSLPVHWGISGEADIFLPRDAALLMFPGIALATAVLLVVLPRLLGQAQADASRHAIAAIVPALLGLFLAIEVATVLIGMGQAVDMVRFVVLGVGIVFAVVGNVAPKTQRNLIAGVRVPWTLADPANWQATNRLFGGLLLLGGLVMAGTALVVANPVVLLGVTAAGVLVPVVVALVYSWRRARRE